MFFAIAYSVAPEMRLLQSPLIRGCFVSGFLFLMWI